MSKNNGTNQLDKSPAEKFTALIQTGILCWVEAGKLLNEELAKDPQFRQRLMEENPWLTMDVLYTFERIGRREIYPQLMLDCSPAAKRIIQFPYEVQESLYGSMIEIYAEDEGRRISKCTRKISSLTHREVKVAFDENGLRPIEAQLPIAKKIYRKISWVGTDVSGKIKKVKSDADEAAEQDYDFDASLPKEDLDAPSERESETIDESLRRVQQELLRARTFLSEHPQADRLDDYISNALKPIGTLRFLLGGDAT